MSLQTYIEKNAPIVLGDIEEKLKADLAAFESTLRQKMEEVKKQYDQGVTLEITSRVAQHKFNFKHEKQTALFKEEEEVFNKLYASVVISMVQDASMLSRYVQKFLHAVKENGADGTIVVYGAHADVLKKELEKQKVTHIKEGHKKSTLGGMMFFSSEIEIDYDLDDLVEQLKTVSLREVVNLLFA